MIGFNEAGELVGKAQLPDQTYHAYLANRRGITDLGTQDGDPCSYALQINSKKQIVGNSDDCAGNNSHAFLWENDQMIDLNALVPHGSAFMLTVGLSINDRGEITAQSVLANGDQRAIVMIPCDEDHPGIKDCDYKLVEANSTNPVPPAQKPRNGNQWDPQLQRLPNLRPLGSHSTFWRRRLATQQR